MATDDGHDSCRKHRRSSSPDGADRSPKRHRHGRYHRHGSRKRDEESEHDCETFPAVHSPTPPSNSGLSRHVPDNDNVEEGEILEEDDGDVGKQLKQSDAGLFVRETSLHAKDLKASDDECISPNGEDETYRWSHNGHGIHEDDGFPKYSSGDPEDGKDARSNKDGMDNGLLDH